MLEVNESVLPNTCKTIAVLRAFNADWNTVCTVKLIKRCRAMPARISDPTRVEGYMDSDFPPTSSSIFISFQAEPHQIVWRRPAEFLKEPRLFPD
jgi:hypothetical protein